MKLRGIIPAMVTPMHEDESINVEELRNQCERQIAAGAAALFCLGTNGEFYALSHDEKKLVMRVMAETAKGRIPIMAGTGCVTTAETIELTLYAKELGYDLVSVIEPYFAQSSQEVMYRHYTEVANTCRIPMILYNIPPRTGINMEPSLVKRLAENPYIIGIKDSSGNFDNTLAYLHETPDDFIVLCGNDSHILPGLKAGMNGGIAGCANICPKRMVSIFRLFEEGRLEEAELAQQSLVPLRSLFPGIGSLPVIKRGMQLAGMPVGPSRRPFNIDLPELDKKLLDVLKLYEE
ncbi:MAG: 4-hydroxy-tetrahydrodipicolinate synthase [Firmicutes bacterium]|nr:4-hydroxy-tetrahydrodipicolinate synthase [Bacillota bacterium]